MAKIINQTMEISVCAQNSYSPVKLTQTIELAPNEAQVPQDLERWCLEHLSSLALEYAKKIASEVNPQAVETTSLTAQVKPLGNNYKGNNYKGYTKNNYQANMNVANMDVLLNTPVPQNFFGNTTPQKFQQFGYTLRACSIKELNFLAFGCKKAQGSVVAQNAAMLIQMGYQG